MPLVVPPVRWVLPAVLIFQVLHTVQGELLQVNAENNAQELHRNKASTSKTTQYLLTGNNKPHIVLIVADDLGWHDMSWHNSKVNTPNLGELARTGVILNQSYVMHICTPSRSALMTGRYPFTIGRQHGVIRPMEPVGLTMNVTTILPQELKTLGYSTHAVGKWHLGFCNWKYTPTKRGFDTFYGYYNGAEDYFTHRRAQLTEESSDGDYCVSTRPEFLNTTVAANNFTTTTTSTTTATTRRNSTQESVNKQTLEESSSMSVQSECPARRGGYDFRNDTQPDFDVEQTYSTYVFASYIEKLLNGRNASDPMFLYLPFQSVHGPLQVPEKYIEPFKYVKDTNRRTYMGMLSAMDEAVGRIVRALKETQHYNNSIIVFTTDNGGQTMTGGNNWPLRGRKGTLWEGGTRGSAFIHSPLLKHTSGTVSNQLIHVSDWYATLVGVAGGDIPKDLDSIDQWEALAGNTDPPRDIMIYNLDDSEGIKGAIRKGDYKLLLGDQGFDEWVAPPEGLPEDNVKEVHNEINTVNKLDIKIKPCSSTNQSLDILSIIVDIHRENKASKSLLNTKKRKIINKRNVKRRLRNKEKLKQKIQRAKEEFQNKISIESNDNNLIIGSSFNRNNKKNMKMKKQALSTRQLQNVDQGEQRLFNLNNSTGSPKISEDQRTRLSPVIFADLVNWRAEDLITHKELQLRLFNIKEDPTEHNDIAEKKPSLVIELLDHLIMELPRLIEPDVKPEDNRANPKYWEDIWSPGWC